jgi:hypothetical protein
MRRIEQRPLVRDHDVRVGPDNGHQRRTAQPRRGCARGAERSQRYGRDGHGFDDLWENLTLREQSFVVYGLARLVAEYRRELGHAPDAVHRVSLSLTALRVRGRPPFSRR